MTVKKYHPLLVTLHWLLALMLIVGLFMGFNVLAATPNTNPEKIFLLKMHMSMGFMILFLMIVRLVTRINTAKPADADIGYPLLNKMAKAAHHSLYLAVFLMVLSGMAISLMAGLPEIVFLGIGTLPANFHDVPAHEVHEMIGALLALLILGHIAAALYHQFVRKDQLFARMWFGKRD